MLPTNIKSKILRLKGKKISEADTKRTIIQPILATLGWDMDDVIEVKNEYRKQSTDNPVDYALFVGNRPVLFIEAKALDVGIEDRKAICQALAYANACGVAWCALTDGDNWRIYNTHAPVDADEKELRRISITLDINVSDLSLLSKENFQGSALRNIWDLEFTGKHLLRTLSKLVSESNPALVSLLKRESRLIERDAIKQVLPCISLSIDFSTRSVTKPTIQKVKVGGTGKRKDVIKLKLIDLINAGKLTVGASLQGRKPRSATGNYPNATVLADGALEVESKQFYSPSGAGSFARHFLHKKGLPKDYPTDGYDFWLYNGKTLDDLRSELVNSSPTPLASSAISKLDDFFNRMVEHDALWFGRNYGNVSNVLKDGKVYGMTKVDVYNGSCTRTTKKIRKLSNGWFYTRYLSTAVILDILRKFENE